MSYLSPSSHRNPRSRYLAALAEAEAAKTEYLAAEAAQREENALRRRLEEIQLRKQEQELAQYNSRTRFLDLDAHPQTYRNTRLAALRQQVEEEEERLRLLASRDARRRQEEEESLILALRRQQQAALLRREREEALAAVTLQRNAIYAKQLLASTEQKRDPHHSVAALRTLLGPEVQVIDQVDVLPTTTLSSPYHSTKSVASCHCAPLRGDTAHTYRCHRAKVDHHQLLGTRPDVHEGGHCPALPTSNGMPNSTAQQNRQIESLEQLFNLLGLPLQLAQPQTPVPSQEPSTQNGTHHLLSLFGLPTSEQAKHAPQSFVSSSKQQPERNHLKTHSMQTPATPSADAKVSPSVETSFKNQLEARLNKEYHSEVKDTIQAIFASLQDAKSYQNSTFAQGEINKANCQSTASAPVETSLKEQLEARLVSDYDAETKDTIQAIFASLQDSHPFPNSHGFHNMSTKAETSKGKEKSLESNPIAPTSMDVINSMNQVHSVETAFQTLEDDFVFPQQLDFIASHITVDASPTSTDSETSPTTHLAYTSRNQPVRFYEQALSGLLTQLDSVDSFGNEEVRERRKSVVVRVERALEELEREVEGRWKARINKEVKAVRIQVADPTVGQIGSDKPKSEAVVQSSEHQADLQTVQVAADEPVLEPTTLESVSKALSSTPEASTTLETSDEEAPSVTPHTLTPSEIVLPHTSTDTEPQAADDSVSSEVNSASVAPAPSVGIPSGDVDTTLPPATELSPEAYPPATTDVPNADHEDVFSSATSATASEVTFKDNDVATRPTLLAEPVLDTFLLTASEGNAIRKRPNNRESDDGASDWSEIEA